jgi:hypothetical protein
MQAARVAQLKAMDAAALMAELRALSDAGGSVDEQVRCCSYLYDRRENGHASLPTGEAAEDAVRAVVPALSRGVQHATLQVAACIALGMLVLEAPATSATAGAAGGVTAVMAALRAHLGNARVQSAACFALAHLVALDAPIRATAVAAGGVTAALAAMTRHAADLKVATHACLALSHLILNHPQSAAEALHGSTVTAVLAAMRAFPADEELQLGCCCVLSHLAGAAGTLGGACFDAAVVDAALTAMRAHAGAHALQGHGCTLLTRVLRDDRNADAAWVRRGGEALALITAALRTHQDDVHVLTIGCMALSFVMLYTEDNKRTAGIADAIEAVVAAMRAFPAAVNAADMADLQPNALSALANMCRDVRDNQVAAAAAGALEVIVSAMRMHASNGDVQSAGCLALGTLVGGVPASQTRAGELGGVEAMVAALRCCAVALPAVHRPRFLHGWNELMSLLLRDHPINKHKAVTAGAIETVLACMPLAADVDDDVAATVLHSTCVVMRSLVIGGGHEARAVLAGVLEVLEAQTGRSVDVETARVQLIRGLQPAAQRHDAAPCAVAICQRCGAARTCGVMCALPGCGARTRDGGAKKLLRCGTCRAACYCGAAHQREDWRRHKGSCVAPARADDPAAGASGS